MLGVSSRRSDRFRLVNLEEGEFLLEEVEATMRVDRGRDCEPLPALNRGKAADGRLRVCTRGLLFEPDDRSVPMMRFSWRDMEGEPEAVRTAAGLQLTCQVRSVTTLKANNVVAPYSDETPASGGAWAPVIAAIESNSADELMALLTRLWGISEASGGRGGPRESKQLEPLIRQRWEGPFDAALVRDFSERRLLDEPILCELIAPLVSCPGRLMVTNAAVYFQHASLNHADRTLRCRRWPLTSLSMVARRRHLLQETGLELRCRTDGEAAAGGGGGGSGGAGVAPPGAGVGWLGLSGETQNWARGRLEPALEAEDYGRPMPETSTAALLAFRSHADRESVVALLVSQAPAGFLRPLAAVVAAADPSTNPKQEAGGGASPVPDVATAILERQSDSLGTRAQRLMDDRVGRLDGLEATALAAACRAWQEGALSTLDYLHLVNEAAGRTKLDLAQYPVFPWVVSDWESETLDLQDPASFRDLSRPIAALCDDRLRAARRRMAEMPAGEGEHAPFLFGTHYSTPGYVLFFLVRSAPEHMLRLQSGEFDRADRLFLSMAGCWRGVTSNPADVKELIPEFYEGDGSFLQLHGQLHLGRSASTGDVVGDVELPPWADDGEDLVRLLREALESQFVSQHLHHWIDLIFGVDQKGPRAAAKDNVFHPLTYEGTVQLSSIRDPAEREAKMVQIAEFGQCPRQVFLRPHPRRGGPSLPRNPAALQHTSSALQDALADWTAERGGRARAAAAGAGGGGRQPETGSLDAAGASSLPSLQAGSSVCSRGEQAGGAAAGGGASSRASGELSRGFSAGPSDAASAASPRHQDPSSQAAQEKSIGGDAAGTESSEASVSAASLSAAAVAAGRWLQNGPKGGVPGSSAPRSAAATKPLSVGWQRLSGLARPSSQASTPLAALLLPESEPLRCVVSLGQDGAAAVTGVGRDGSSATKLASRPVCTAAMLPGDRQLALGCADGSLRLVAVSKAVSAGADAAAAAADRSESVSAAAGASTTAAGGQVLPAHAGRTSCLCLLPIAAPGGSAEALLLSGGSDGILRGWPLSAATAPAKRKSSPARPSRWEVSVPDAQARAKGQDTPLHAFERSDHQRYPLTAVTAWGSRVVTGASDGSLVWYDLTATRREAEDGDGGRLGFSCSPVVAMSAPSTGLDCSGVLGVTALVWAGQRDGSGASLAPEGAPAQSSTREALLLVGSASGCVSIFSKSADLLARIVTGEPVRSLATGNSGNLVATAGDWGVLRLWNLPAIVSSAQRAAKTEGGAAIAVTSTSAGCQVGAFGIDPSRSTASLGQEAQLAASLQFLRGLSKGQEEGAPATATAPRPSGALALCLSADERVLVAGTTLGSLQVWHRAFA